MLFYSAWHHIDPHLLREDLFESFMYMLAQPPLFNLFLGIILKFFKNAFPIVFYAVFLGLVLAICLIMYLFAKDLVICKHLAFSLALVFSLSPDAVLHENTLIYSPLRL